MDALKQYIDLYRDHRTLVEENSCSPLNSFRQEALDVLEAKGLPAKGSENYELSDPDLMLSPDFGINLARLEIDANPMASFRCGVPTLSAAVYFQINDIFKTSRLGETKLPEGMFVGSLKEFYKSYPDIFAKYYGKSADMGNPMVALNSLLVQDGVVVYAAKGVKAEIPVQLVNILHNGMPLMAVRRLLVIVEEDADIKILSCDHTQLDNIDFMNLQVGEIFVGKNASLDYYELEESSIKTTRWSSLYLHQSSGSRMILEGITLFNGTTRNEYYCLLKGEDCRLNLLGLGIEDKDRMLDTYSRVDHLEPRCVTDEMFKYVVDDEARGSFAGLIKVSKGAVKTEAYQSNRNIVGSEKARMFSKPQLEIYDDDVKCSHGCTVGQLDEKQVFYMQTRGIPEKEAKFLLKQAFMSDIIDRVELPALRDRLRLLVEKRFAGETFNCAGCGAGCIDIIEEETSPADPD